MATKTDYYDVFARWISVILGPHVWLPVLFFLVVFRSGLTPNQLKIIFPSILILEIIIPIAYLLLGPKLGFTKEWDMKEIKERKPFLYLVLILSLISLGIVYIFGNVYLLNLSTIFLAWLVVFLLITRFWKISLHVGLNVFAAIMVNFLFGWRFPAIYLIIPIIFWARLRLKKHSLNQLIAGFLITVTILFGGLAIFRYI